MRQALRLHPDSRCKAALHIDTDAARPRPGGLVVRYVVTGDLGHLRMPSVTPAMRADQLWQHTCFEAFVRALPGAAYYEFNFAPSTQWAAYRFSGYRSGMCVASEMSAPRVEVRSDDKSYELQASLELGRLPGLPCEAAWSLGLSAVIEEAGGRKSYWALTHPPGKADFHHPDCFTYQLPAP